MARALLLVALAAVMAAPCLAARQLAQAPAPTPAPGVGLIPAAQVAKMSPLHQNNGFDDVTAKQAYEIVKNGGVFIDVREPAEYAAAHLPGSLNLIVLYKNQTQGTWIWSEYNKEFVNQVIKAVPNKDTPIVVTCWGGGNSRIASNLLEVAGYKNVSNLAFGFSSSGFSTGAPTDLWGDYKSQGLPIESNLTTLNATEFTTGRLGEKVLGFKLPLDSPYVTTFVPGDEYLLYVGRVLGFPAPAGATIDDVVKFIAANETLVGQLRHALVAGIIPGAYSQADFDRIGLTGLDNAIGEKVQFNVSGTRIANKLYGKTNIYGRVANSPNGYIIDWLPVPLTATSGTAFGSTVKPITAAEAQKIVDDAIAKGKALAAAKAPAPAPKR